jgi:hypothetical protein
VQGCAGRGHQQAFRYRDPDGAHASFIPEAEPGVEAPLPDTRVERAQEYMVRVWDRRVAGELAKPRPVQFGHCRKGMELDLAVSDPWKFRPQAPM